MYAKGYKRRSKTGSYIARKKRFARASRVKRKPRHGTKTVITKYRW